MLDLVLLFICSWVVVKKLKSVIGNEVNSEKPHHIQRNFEVSDTDKVFNDFSPDLKEKISEIESLVNFNFTDFIKKAEQCFELFIDAVNTKDVKKVSSFSEPELIQKLEKKIEDKEKNNIYVEIVEVKRFEITEIYKKNQDVFLEIKSDTSQNITTGKMIYNDILVSEKLTFKQNVHNPKLWTLQNIYDNK